MCSQRAQIQIGEDMFTSYFSTVTSDSEPSPSKWLIMMHGIYGRGANWKTAARKISELRPSWGVLLVDLRMHGRSKGAPGPHTLASCAGDVLSLMDQQRESGRDVEMVVGHSFGGKVALTMREQRPDMCPLWLIDSGPGPRPGMLEDPSNTVVSVLSMLEELPPTFSDRAEFLAAVQSYGFAKPLAQWLGMNLESCAAGYRSSVDTAAMRSLLADFFERDLWGAIEGSQTPVHVALASRGSSVAQTDRERLHATQQVEAHELDGGHWLHVDALGPLVERIVGSLS